MSPRRFKLGHYALNTATNNWNGNTPEVYVVASDPPVGHHALASRTPVDKRDD
jgi:hypothetical protein